MAKSTKQSNGDIVVKPNVIQRIGMFIKQIIDEMRKVVTPTRKQLFMWVLAVFIFVVLLMVLVTAMDFGLGNLAFLIFG
ncbi:preprotein translocase subunit SecE [Bifidobacterium dolichotidis]|uniref:Protein translocase subunit SecE n=1 Tax=Bifidobacterium dolichotidis TaxID=2306976 RepID=A0A430FQD3_9BIFI|nr:preprotein translocase subunit SecE [Bifidobacterium dolichotidis]RSX55052.1 preprotein translocase subunit SecE [Bifidobacterium dolichotidis]